MAWKGVLILIALLQLDIKVECEEGDFWIKRFSRQFKFHSPHMELGQNTIHFSVPAIFDQRVHVAALICNWKQKNCRLHRHIGPFNIDEYGIERDKVCDFENKNLKYESKERVNVVLLQNDIAIVDTIYENSTDKYVFQATYKRDIRVLRISNCSTVRIIDLNIKKPLSKKIFSAINTSVTDVRSMHHLMVHSNGKEFDVFYENEDLCIFGNARNTFDQEGNSKNKFQCYLDDIMRHRGTAFDNEDKIIFYRDQYALSSNTNTFWTGFIMNKEGTEFRNLEGTEFNELYEKYRISSRYDRVTICNIPEKQGRSGPILDETPNYEVECGIYKQSNNKIEGYKIKLGLRDYYGGYEIFNLPNNQIAVLKTRAWFNERDERTYDLWIYDEIGRRVGHGKMLTGASCPRELNGVSEYRSFFAMDGDSVCVAFSCVDVREQFGLREGEGSLDHLYSFAVECVSIKTSQKSPILLGSTNEVQYTVELL